MYQSAHAWNVSIALKLRLKRQVSSTYTLTPRIELRADGPKVVLGAGHLETSAACIRQTLPAIQAAAARRETGRGTFMRNFDLPSQAIML